MRSYVPLQSRQAAHLLSENFVENLFFLPARDRVGKPLRLTPAPDPGSTMARPPTLSACERAAKSLLEAGVDPSVQQYGTSCCCECLGSVSSVA